jgi:response regulator RpfG family c-di-GMP phosphodiesterase
MPAMRRVMVVGCDQHMCDLLWQRLADAAEIIEASDSSEALALTLQYKPDCILLDSGMPHLAAYELCQSFSHLESTRSTPVFVIGSEGAVRYKDLWRDLGARAYFEHPMDLASLRVRVCEVLRQKPPERRAEARVAVGVILQINGKDVSGTTFQRLVLTQDVSASGFFCGCPVSLQKDAVVSVLFIGEIVGYLGGARVVRTERLNGLGQGCAFQFLEKPHGWLPKIWPSRRFVPSWARA